MLSTSLCCLARAFSVAGSFFSAIEKSQSPNIVSEKMSPPYFLMSLLNLLTFFHASGLEQFS